MTKGAGLLVLSALLLGCESRLETGYEPRKLGVSDTQRRGYYAAPYTPEARAASQDHGYGSDTGMLRPGMGSP